MKPYVKMLIALSAWLGFVLPVHASAQGAKDVTLYKNPFCGCCEGHASYLRQNGFNVEVVPTKDLSAIAAAKGVPEELQGCHLSLVGGYVVAGHVGAGLINRLLAEKPHIAGISLPGMPSGAPGMGGPKDGPLAVYEIAPGMPAYGTQ